MRNISSARAGKLIFFGLALLVFLLDQAVKLLFRQKDADFRVSILHLHFVQNTGAAFGLFRGSSFILAVIGIIIFSAIIYYYRQLPESPLARVGAALVLGGTAGNIIDRVLFGFVTDFIDLGFWPAFNVADSALAIGTFMLACYFYRNR